MGQLRSDIGVWVVGAVALIALVVFGGLWLTQTSLLSRLDGISRETRRQNEQLQAKVTVLQGEVKKLEARLAERAESATEPAGTFKPEVVKGRVYVRVTSQPPGARVRRDNRTLGRTPIVLPMRRDETATLVIQHLGYAAEEVTVKAEDGSAVTVRLKKKRSVKALANPFE